MDQKGKVTLISVDEFGPSMGTRFLSSVLKQANYETTVIFCLGRSTKEIAMKKTQAFSDEVHDKIAKLAEGSLYIGLSVATPTYHKAREITEKLKSRLEIPVIWGGVHAIVKPVECLNHADMVCLGEGENIVIELAHRLRENMPYDDIPGIMLRGESGKTGVQLNDISHIPRPDYVFDGTHYLATSQNIAVFDVNAYKLLINSDYYIAPTRGCPYKCTYCINSKYSERYKDARRFRKRKLDNIIEELVWAKNNIPVTRRIVIDDDCFMALKTEDILYFAEEYEKHVGLPFIIRGAHPQNVTEVRLNALCDAGMIKLRIGIQTGSDRTRKLFARTWENNKTITDITNLISKFIKKGSLKYVMYDVILDNPWETEEDYRQTLDMILSLPGPFGLYCFSLTFYPGSVLYERALSEGRVQGNTMDEAYWVQYWDLSPGPVNDTIWLISRLAIPTWLAKLFSRPRFRLADTIRGILKKIYFRIPELSILFQTKNRYEVDFMILHDPDIVHDFMRDFFRIHLRDGEVLYLHEVVMPFFQLIGKKRREDYPKPLIFIRAFILYFYIRFLAPRRP